MSWIEKEFNLKGIATDVNTFEWEEEDWVNKAPVVLTKVAKRPGGFTLYMKSLTQELEWYFSKGLTNIFFKDDGKTLRIEHEDGTYYVDLQPSQELYEFLKEFIQEEENV
ncbi:hypothetical protein [Sulfurihydrogenibium subterraneum]|uniref:hypothetical protein n=1 Tax=Sulfurihydrogenibium subterraneum TaxID=171121 RepID=UPI00056B461F|nr:hypothetical protein [Sulfurihydrogenibium subterraneum]